MVSSGKNAVCSRKLRLHTAFIQIYQYFIGMKKLLLTFVLLTAVFATVFGDNVPSEKSYPVTGKVVDADTEEPLAGAMLKVNGGAKAGCSSRHLLQTCGLRVTAVDKNGVYWWLFFDLSVYG